MKYTCSKYFEHEILFTGYSRCLSGSKVIIFSLSLFEKNKCIKQKSNLVTSEVSGWWWNCTGTVSNGVTQGVLQGYLPAQVTGSESNPSFSQKSYLSRDARSSEKPCVKESAFTEQKRNSLEILEYTEFQSWMDLRPVASSQKTSTSPDPLLCLSTVCHKNHGIRIK